MTDGNKDNENTSILFWKLMETKYRLQKKEEMENVVES